MIPDPVLVLVFLVGVELERAVVDPVGPAVVVGVLGAVQIICAVRHAIGHHATGNLGTQAADLPLPEVGADLVSALPHLPGRGEAGATGLLVAGGPH